MIVVAIIGILAAIAIPAYQDYVIRSQVTEGLSMASATKASVAEFFADRPLRADGSVVMFGWQEQFTPTPEAVGLRVRSLLESGTVPALGGTPVAVQAETVCVHSDTPRADELGLAVRAVIGDRAPVEAPMNGGGISV